MRTLKLISLICLVAFVTACPDKPSREFDNVLVQKINAGLLEEWKRYDCSARGKSYTVAYPSNVATCNESGANANGENEAIRIRTEVVEKASGLIDANYGDYIRTLDRRRSKMEFVADVIELGTGAATGISKGERPNQILGIALTAFRGGRRSSELAFYKQQTTPILISKMDDNRAQIYSAMFQKRGKSPRDYPWNEMIRDLVGYYNAGTLVRAFTELNKDASSKAKESEDVLRVLKGENITISNIPTVQHERISDDVFALRLSLAKQLDEANQTTAAAEKTAKLAAVRLKYDAVWKDIEANEKFAPLVNQLKADPDLTAVFAKFPANRTSVTPEEFDLLISKFTSKVSRISKDTKNPELFDEFLKILQKANK